MPICLIALEMGRIMSDSDERRLFVAIDADIEVVDEIDRLQTAFRNSLDSPNADLRWIIPDQFHLTLKFLDYTSEELLPGIDQALSDISQKHASFELSLNQWGCFPEPSAIRVVWIGPSSQTRPPVHRLHKDIDNRLELLGIEPEYREFVPHVTLCRVQEDPQDEVTNHYLNYSDAFQISLPVNSFHLYQSRPQASGVIHTILETYELN